MGKREVGQHWEFVKFKITPPKASAVLGGPLPTGAVLSVLSAA